VVDLEERETWPDGRETWASTTKLARTDPDGKVVGTFGVSRDITERKHNEAALEASERQLRTALDTMIDGVTIQSAVRDNHGRIVDFRVDYANSAIGVIGGMAGSLQAGRTLLELFPAHRTKGSSMPTSTWSRPASRSNPKRSTTSTMTRGRAARPGARPARREAR
jgi:PAS domain-containing protein